MLVYNASARDSRDFDSNNIGQDRRKIGKQLMTGGQAEGPSKLAAQTKMFVKKRSFKPDKPTTGN